MKKLVMLITVLLLAAGISVTTASAEYLPEYDKYVEVTYDQARQAADLLGLKEIPLGEETANASFEIQEKFISKLEKILKTDIDHYYIWLTVDGEVVLGIDPPFPGY